MMSASSNRPEGPGSTPSTVCPKSWTCLEENKWLFIECLFYKRSEYLDTFRCPKDIVNLILKIFKFFVGHIINFADKLLNVVPCNITIERHDDDFC